ncbi:hypothetical protein AXW67_10335 [Bradyrhizobium neotropicale]|uniref:Uncharacterized protein n=1 Tax=Bradyrhizobium neotropicale TaxID=1497615 RepID=A0A176ZBG6_9BRAD|nr:hypothetical protein AXW67_10335 [Bradyrhizobium neotropicale]
MAQPDFIALTLIERAKQSTIEDCQECRFSQSVDAYDCVHTSLERMHDSLGLLRLKEFVTLNFNSSDYRKLDHDRKGLLARAKLPVRQMH